MVGIGQNIRVKKEDGSEIVGQTVEIDRSLVMRDGDGELQSIQYTEIESIIQTSSCPPLATAAVEA